MGDAARGRGGKTLRNLFTPDVSLPRVQISTNGAHGLTSLAKNGGSGQYVYVQHCWLCWSETKAETLSFIGQYATNPATAVGLGSIRLLLEVITLRQNHLTLE